MKLRACVTALLAAFAAGHVLGQSQSPSPGGAHDSEAVFRTGVTAARIDVVVTDADGRAVIGLTAGDFEIVERGRPRPITAFQAVALPVQAGATMPVLPATDVAANDRAPGRIFVFGLDWVAPCDALRTRHLLRQFVEAHLGPHDLASVAVLGPSLATDGQDFTSDRQRLLEAIDKYSGGFARACERRYTPPGRLHGGQREQMANLRALVESLARVPGRKALLLFTQSLEIDMLDLVDHGGGVLGLAGEEARAALRAATRGGVSIYPIDPAGITPEHVPIATSSAFQALARTTGGSALINSNSLAEMFERIAREQSVHYTLGFESDAARADGRFVPVEVRTRRPGLTVRAPQGYVAASRDEMRIARDAEVEPAVARALAIPVSTAGVSMRVSAAPFRGRRNASVVRVVTEIDMPSLDLAERDGRLTGTIEVRQVVTTARDRSFPESRYAVPIDVASARQPGHPEVVRVVSTLSLPPGRHQLRVAAGTAAGAGSVVVDLETPRWDDLPYAIGGVLLATEATRGAVAFRASVESDTVPKARRCRPPDCKDGRKTAPLSLRAWPRDTETSTAAGAALAGHEADGWLASATTARTFSSGDTIDVHTEIYDRRSAQRATAPSPLVIATELRDAGGKVVRRIEETRAPGGQSGPRYTVRLPLDGLGEGSYEILIAASPASTPGDPVERVVPIRISGAP